MSESTQPKSYRLYYRYNRVYEAIPDTVNDKLTYVIKLLQRMEQKLSEIAEKLETCK